MNSGQLGGNSPTPGTGIWTQVSGFGFTTFNTPNTGSSTATVTAYGAYIYQWTISNGTCAPSSVHVVVNYYQNPSTATVGSTQNICGSLISATLGGNIPNTGVGVWSQVSGSGTTTFNNPNTGSTIANVTAYGTYIYQWTISNGACAASSARDSVNYYSLPSVSITSDPANDSVCSGSPLLLTASASGGSNGNYSYTWSTNAGTVATNTAMPSTATPTSGGPPAVYSVTVTDGHSCHNNNSINITIDALPTVTISSTTLASVSASTVCRGAIVRLIANGSSTTGHYSYVWSNYGFGTMTTDTIINTQDSTIAYAVTLTDLNGCKASATSTVVVVQQPSLSVSFTRDTICYAQQVTLSATGNINAQVGSINYIFQEDISGQWNTLQNGSISAYSPVRPVPGIHTYRVTLPADTSLGCLSVTDTLQLHVDTLPAPAIPLTSDPAGICTGTIGQFFTTVPQPDLTYTWTSSPGLLLSNIHGPNTEIDFPNAGIYDIILQDSNLLGCINFDTLKITVSSNIATGGRVILDTLGNNLVCLNNTAQSYLWGYDQRSNYQSDTITPYQTQQYYLAGGSLDTASNYYWVLITDSNGCSTKAYFNSSAYINTSISNLIADADISLSPNPGSGSYVLKISSPQMHQYDIYVINASGQIIKEEKLDADHINYSFALDSSSGLYYLRLTNELGESKIVPFINLSK